MPDLPPMDLMSGIDDTSTGLKTVSAAGIVTGAQAATGSVFPPFLQNLIGGMNFQSIAGGIGDLFQATGDRLEAKNYEEAQHLALINKQFTKSSTAIEQQQAGRQIAQTIGAQEAGVGGTGFAETGSAMSLLRSSAQQGALAHQTIAVNGLLAETSEQAQADAYGNMAKAAKNAATGDTVAGIGGIIGGFAKFLGF